jgi:uncharacterized protein (TIGR00369 family)
VDLGALLGIEVTRSSEVSATAAVTVDDRHLNRNGTVHGGAIATLVDIAMGAAVASSRLGARAAWSTPIPQSAIGTRRDVGDAVAAGRPRLAGRDLGHGPASTGR